MSPAQVRKPPRAGTLAARVLDLVDRRGEATSREVADATGVGVAKASGTLDYLCRGGLVRRPFGPGESWVSQRDLSEPSETHLSLVPDHPPPRAEGARLTPQERYEVQIGQLQTASIRLRELGKGLRYSHEIVGRLPRQLEAHDEVLCVLLDRAGRLERLARDLYAIARVMSGADSELLP